MSGAVVCRSMAEVVLGFAKFGTALYGDSGFGILGEPASVSAFPVAIMTFTSWQDPDTMWPLDPVRIRRS